MKQGKGWRRHQTARGLATAACLGGLSAAGWAKPNVVAFNGWAMDQTEVTIAQFGRFVQATGLQTQAEREGGGFEFAAGWERRPGWTWYAPNGERDADPRLPAVHVTHAEAQRYCQWAGGTLPSASQWQQAAYVEQRPAPPKGLVRGQRYPYPTGADAQGANTSNPDPWPRAAPAGATRAGVNGLYDMGANVWEWVSDAQGQTRRTMGGSWWYPPYQMQANVVAYKPASFYAVYIGFRCVYPAPAAANQ